MKCSFTLVVDDHDVPGSESWETAVREFEELDTLDRMRAFRVLLGSYITNPMQSTFTVTVTAERLQ